MRITEENFVEQLKKRNEAALMYVIDQYGWVLKSVTKKVMGTLPHLWDDCMNDTLLAVWDNIDSYMPGRSEFQSWLAGVCRFKALDYVRRYIHASKEELRDEMPELEDGAAKKEFLRLEYEEEVRMLLDMLSGEDAEIFRMIYLEGMTPNEVSAKMKLSKSVIYGRVSRGKKQLRSKTGKAEV